MDDNIKTRCQLHRFNSNKETQAIIEKHPLQLPQLSLPISSSVSVIGVQHKKTKYDMSRGVQSYNACDKNKIVTQLAPEEFSIEDVQQLQKFIRELHVENMQKTVAYIKLEHAYHSLKDEVAALTKHIVAKQRSEAFEVPEHQISENPDKDPPKDELIKELNLYKEKCAVMQYEEANLRKLVKDCEERFEHFQSVITDSSATLVKNKNLLDNTMLKVQFLESELVVWKERTKDYEKLLQDEKSRFCKDLEENQGIRHNLAAPSATEKCKDAVQCIQYRTDLDDNTDVSSEHGPSSNDRSVTGTSFFKYLAPKANSCFSSVKATFCRCPSVSVQDNTVQKPIEIDGKT